MKKILFLFISVLGVMQAQITISHESGIVPYGTEIVITAPTSTDTVWYAWDGHNPFSEHGQYIVGGGTIIVPQPNEHAPYWSHFPSMADSAVQLFAGQAEVIQIPDSIDYVLDSVFKTNILRIYSNNKESTHFFIDPITLVRHLDIAIINIAIDEEDGFGGRGILVAGDCTLQNDVYYPEHHSGEWINGEMSANHNESIFLPDSIVNHQSDIYYFGNVYYAPNVYIDTFVYFQNLDSIYALVEENGEVEENIFVGILFNYDSSLNGYVFSWESQLGNFFLTNPCYDDKPHYSKDSLCVPNFTIDNDLFNLYPEMEKSLIYKPISLFIYEDGWVHQGDATVRIAGNYSRQHGAKMLRIKTSKKDIVQNDLFGNNITRHRTFALRKPGVVSHVIDDWLSHFLAQKEGIDVSPQSAKPCILYLNGEYWGLYIMQERFDDHYLENHNMQVERDDILRYEWKSCSRNPEEFGPHPKSAHRDSIQSRKERVKILEYIDTVNMNRNNIHTEIESYLDYKAFYLVRNYSAATARVDFNGNSRFWMSVYDAQIKEAMKDFDFTYMLNQLNINHWDEHYYTPSPHTGGESIEGILYRRLNDNDTLSYWNINTCSDLQTMVMHPDTLSKYITSLASKVWPHLNKNYLRWGHLPNCEPDSLEYFQVVENLLSFSQDRYYNINNFFISDFEKVTGITNMYLEKKHICDAGNLSIFNEIYVSTVPAKDYNTPRWRHSYDVPTPLSYNGDLLYWVINNDTVYDVDNVWIDVHKDSTYFVTGVFGCKTDHIAQGKLKINEIVAAQNNIIETPFGGFEDYVELYNSSNDSINLEGLYFSDKADNKTRYQIEYDLIIPPLEYILIWCDDRSILGANHTNFKLNKDGEYFIIFDGQEVIDSISWDEEIPRNVSLSLCGDEWVYLLPSPLERNPCLTEEEILSQRNVDVVNINIFPNPTSDEITISGEWENVDILSVEGKRVSTSVYGERISLITLPKGMYIIAVHTDTAIVYRKVIKN